MSPVPYIPAPAYFDTAHTEDPRLPDNVSFTEGALLEPLSVVLEALRVASLTLGRGAVICGAGPIGLTALLASRASGAHPLVITDVEPKRLEFAKQLVPSCLTYQIDISADARGNARGIRELFGARGGEGEDGEEYLAPPSVIECTGVESSVCTAAFTVRRGGKVVVVGVGKNTLNNLPFMHLSLGEVCSPNQLCIGCAANLFARSTFALSTDILIPGLLVSLV